MAEKSEVENSRFARRVEEIQKLLGSGVTADSSGYSLAALLETVQARLDAVQAAETQFEQEKKAQKEKYVAEIALLIEREHGLSSAEKQQYGQFLGQEFFRREDFSKLEEFYANSWDKLSDGGKAQMSQRVWEGVRRYEYTFDELPENVRRKESEWIYLQMIGQKPAAPGLENVPKQDKRDFIRAHEAKDEKAETEILNRPGFSQNIYSEQSASVEADFTKEIKPEEESPEPPKGLDQDINLAGNIPAAGIPPTSLPSASGRGVGKG